MARDVRGYDCPVGCAGLWSTREHRDEHIRRCHPEKMADDDALLFGSGFLMFTRDADGSRKVQHIPSELVTIRKEKEKPA